MSPATTRKSRAVPAPEIACERYELSCGAILLVSRRSGAPITAVRAHMRGGASLDPEGKGGLAYLVGGLADQGTQAFSESELAERLEPNGGQLSGDANGLSGSIAGTSWKLLVETLCEVLQHPTYPKERVALQQERLLTRMRAEEDDPRIQAGRLFRRSVYGDVWLGRPPMGTRASLEAVRATDLRKHHRKSWCGSRLVIGVCGDVAPRAVRNLFEKCLGAFPAGKPLEPRKIELPEPSLRCEAFQAKREQVHLYVGHLGIRRSDPDYEALVVMDHVLGTGPGFANRISRRLRDEQGLAYTVHADISSSAGLSRGTFTAYIGTSPQHVGTALDGFRDEMRRIQVEHVGEDELETAKGYLLGSFALGFERASRRAGYLISAELHGFGSDHLTQLTRAFAEVDREDVQRVAAKHLRPEACCVVSGGPLARKELEKLVVGR